MENITKALVILTVTAAMILATAIEVASVTQVAHADKGGIPDAHAGTHPLKSCISHPT
jgi:hypothetical protein